MHAKGAEARADGVRRDDPTLAQKLYVVLADQEAAVQATEQARRDIANLRSGSNAAIPAAKPGAPVPKLSNPTGLQKLVQNGSTNSRKL